MSEKPKRRSNYREKMLEIRRRQLQERQVADIFPSGKSVAPAGEEREEQPKKRQGKQIWTWVQLAVKVPLPMKNRLREFAKAKQVKGGMAGVVLMVCEFLHENPALLLKLLHWRVQDERARRKQAEGQQERKAA